MFDIGQYCSTKRFGGVPRSTENKCNALTCQVILFKRTHKKMRSNFCELNYVRKGELVVICNLLEIYNTQPTNSYKLLIFIILSNNIAQRKHQIYHNNNAKIF